MIVQEDGGRLAARNADGTFNIVLIVEGEGSTGHYSAELMSEASAAAFENVGSHPNHPANRERPEERDPMGLIGRVFNVRPGNDRGRAALIGRFRPGSPEVADYVAEFGDLLGISIFAKAEGRQRGDGKLIVESFDGAWPYRSVDIVLAAGAGGRFRLAQESLLAIESATGATQPAFSITQLAGEASAPPSLTTHSYGVHISPLRDYLKDAS